MNNTVTDIDQWLANGFSDTNEQTDEVWDAGFKADRQLVISKFAGFEKVFLRPKKFSKRFYHTLVPITVEGWHCTDQVKLYDDFCTLDVSIAIRFQPTLDYALSNKEIVTELNKHIKLSYQSLVLDIASRELLNLPNGTWVQEGLQTIENKVSILISEMLILQNIQSQVICKFKPSFEGFPNVQFARENVYLCVLKKSFEFNELQNEEIFRQGQEQEKQKIEHKRKQFIYLNEIAQLDRQKQALHAENNKRLLEEKALQQLEENKARKQIHLDKIKHHQSLKELSLVESLKEKERLQSFSRDNEEKEKTDLIASQIKLKEKELDAEITGYEKEQERWRQAKSKSQIEELEQKHRLKQLEFDSDMDYKQRYEKQRINIQEESYSIKKNADVYLKREIELLELEKKRLALQLTIKRYKVTHNT
ncbi:MAG: hypothetical protein HFP77_08680 [Methylococcales symbiont of Iophon sp. n. MRB-2018]|nr:MAG: hypothetical protein HFP77_08680 [Methylococcales symbiont of Iophon sp. n. MRB-2018]KAF3979370.1 MAG: hypothetical protein HFP76_08000 [Methylococcales symbiont of Iophon sp. n. MRB-2018]